MLLLLQPGYHLQTESLLPHLMATLGALECVAATMMRSHKSRLRLPSLTSAGCESFPPQSLVAAAPDLTLFVLCCRGRFCDNSDESGPRRCCWYPSAWALCECVYAITVTNTQSWRDNWGTNPCRQVANPTHLVQQLANDVTYEGGGANDAGLELPPFSPKTPQFSNLQKNGNRVVQRVCDALFPPPTAPPLPLSGASIITAPMALVAASATLLALFR